MLMQEKINNIEIEAPTKLPNEVGLSVDIKQFNIPIKIPRIGIVGHMLPNGNSLGITLPYLTYFNKFGNVKIISPVAMLVEDDLDLLVIPGGPDVATIRYLKEGEKHSIMTQKPDQAREWFDVYMLPKYIERRIPIFGICRGHQSIAVHFGSKLIQHLSGHDQNKEDERHYLIQSLAYLRTNINGNLIEVTNNQERIDVNSMHHQAVENCPNNAVVAGWTCEAYSNTKNNSCWISSHKYKGDLPEFIPNNKKYIIEALVYNNYPIGSVQWHPEEIHDEFSENLINQLILCSDK